jgi:hypothetical protein
MPYMSEQTDSHLFVLRWKGVGGKWISAQAFKQSL